MKPSKAFVRLRRLTFLVVLMSENPRVSSPSLQLQLLVGLSLFVGYMVLGALSVSLPLIYDGVSLIWPPIGLATVFLYRGGRWLIVPIFLAALTLSLFHVPLLPALGLATGSTVSPLVAVFVLRRLGFSPRAFRLRDTFILVIAAMSGSLFSAAGGPALLQLGGMYDPAGEYFGGAYYWWLADSGGIFIIGAIGLRINRDDWVDLRERLLFYVLIVAGFLLATLLIFGIDYTGRGDLRLMLLSGLSMGLAVFAIQTVFVLAHGLALLMSITGVFLTIQGRGPLVDGDDLVMMTTVWAWVVVNALISCIFGTIQHTLRTAVRKLDQKKILYEALVEGNPALIVRFSTDGLIRFANDTAESMLIAEKQSMVGNNITQFLHPDDWPKVYELLMNRGQYIPIDLKMTDVEGNRHIIRWKARRLEDPDTGLGEYIAVGFDVTDVRRAETERRQFLDRLYHAKKWESMGVMAGGIAHDFNNLLTGIIGHNELAKEMLPLDDPIRFHLDQVQESSRRAAELVQQMMAYAGQAQIKIAPFDLNDTIRQVIDLVRVNLPMQVEVRFYPGENLPNLEADSVQVRQIIMNLLINAGEAIGLSAGTIEIQSDWLQIHQDEPVDPTSDEMLTNLSPGDYLRVRVRDNGSGMDESTRRRVFEPFFSTKFQGRGLGLASVMGIVQAHSGSIGVISKPGRGTLFTFYLPVRYKRPAERGKFKSIEEHETDEPAIPTAGSVMVQMANVTEQAQLHHWFEELGWSTHFNPTDSIMTRKVVSSAPINQVIVLDWDPNASDYIRKLQILQSIPANWRLILVSEFSITARPPDFIKCPTTYLIRPLRQSDLENALRRLFAPGKSLVQKKS